MFTPWMLCLNAQTSLNWDLSFKVIVQLSELAERKAFQLKGKCLFSAAEQHDWFQNWLLLYKFPQNTFPVWQMVMYKGHVGNLFLKFPA